jgi:hypothetical protein
MSEEYGYIYRVEHASKQQLIDLIAKHVGDAGWTFGGAAQWDFVAGHGRGNLRTIERYTSAISINVSGDFGHAFGAYDVLILSEQDRLIENATPLRVRHWNTNNKSWESSTWAIQRHKVAAIQQSAGQRSIMCIDYCAPNGAAQFQRLAGVKS